MIQKVLVIRFSSIGDIVLTTPVVRALKDQLGAEIHFLTKLAFASIVQSNPSIDRVIVLKDDLNETIQLLRFEKYDHIIDLHHNLRSQRIKWALRRPATSFPKLNFEKWLLTRFGIQRLPNVHIVDRYISAAAPLGMHKDEGGLEFFIPAADEIEVTTVFGLAPHQYVAMVIGAAHATKCMIAEQLGQICSLLNRPVILLGGKDEKDKGEAILLHTTNPHVTNSCGRLSIAGSASVVRQAAVVLSHDTGMMHIAAALHRPQVVVWGNTVPQFGMYPYYGSSSATWISIERQGLSCRPCSKIGYTKCPKGHFACMLDHDLKTIVEALHSLWN